MPGTSLNALRCHTPHPFFPFFLSPRSANDRPSISRYASKLIQYGWETQTEALKHGGITGMLARLDNPSKYTSHALSRTLAFCLPSACLLFTFFLPLWF